MRNKKVLAFGIVIPLAMCGCNISGADAVINVDGYEGIALMVENTAAAAVPIPDEPIITVSVDTALTEETNGIDITEETVQSSSVQTELPVAAAEEEWTEKPANGAMYVNTEGIYSIIAAIMGSAKVDRYSLNQEVTVSAITNTNYFRVNGGAYIHADYLNTALVPVRTEGTTPELETDPPETVPEVTEPPETIPEETDPPETVPKETSPPKTEPPKETPTPSGLSIYSADILKNESEAYLKGIDVSWSQGDIDWEAVSKSGIDFAIIRAGRGDIDGTGPKEDKYFLKNIQGANKYGIDVGVYFYSYAWTPDEAKEEARLLLKLLQGHTVTYPVVYDLEERLDRSNITEIAEAFLETIADGGYYPMLYSYRTGIDNYFSRDFKEKYALWIAQRNERPKTDYDYYIWQYSFSGRINGIKGDVDLDIALRNFPEILRKYGLNKLGASG